MIIQILSYLGIGILAGSLSGLLGVGGGIIVVPLLALVFQVFHFPSQTIMHIAIATSLAAMIATTTSSMLTHKYHGAIIWPVFHTLAIGVIFGAIVGTLLVHVLTTTILSILFAILLLTIAVHLWFYHQTNSSRQLPNYFWRNVVGFIIGGKSGLLGIGGGSISVPFLTYCNVSMRDAVGISAACSLTIATTSTVTFMLVGFLFLKTPPANLPAFSTGYIYWIPVMCLAITSPIFAMFGAKLSHQMPVALLRKIFAIFLLIAGIHMLWGVF